MENEMNVTAKYYFALQVTPNNCQKFIVQKNKTFDEMLGLNGFF